MLGCLIILCSPLVASAVRAGEPINVRLDQDWWDFALGLVAVFQACVAGVTLWGMFVSMSATRNQLRPYVFPKSARITFNQSGVAAAKLILENSGETPAFDLEMECTPVMLRPIVEEATVRALPFQFIRRPVSLGGQSERAWPVMIDTLCKALDQNQIAGVNAGELGFFIIGEARYRHNFYVLRRQWNISRFQLYFGRSPDEENFEKLLERAATIEMSFASQGNDMRDVSEFGLYRATVPSVTEETTA